MVFKVSKGGVRSGNTLRGLQTRRTKQYGRHACLYGFSNLHRRDLKDLLSKSYEENELVGETLKKTNVLLSLNKQQRWKVPAALNQLISHGCLDKYPMVSLLERHKLKRRSNCVRFASTGGRLPNVEPKHKKYFSLSLDAIDDEQSNREKRKLRAEALKKIRPNGTRLSRRKGGTVAIDTFTRDGNQSSFLDNGLLRSSRKEYRVEVLYPCPQSCSLSFNPKYTDVVLEEGESGNLEVKSNVQAPKSGRRRRRQHLTPKEFDLCDNAVDDDVKKMWDECYESDTDDTIPEFGNKAQEHQSHMNQFEVLICHAEKVHKILSSISKKRTKTKTKNENLNVKKHIFYIEQKPKEDVEPVQQKKGEMIVQPQHFPEMKSLDFVKVILESSETKEESLQQKYGAAYLEADCQPRRFMINVTDDIANVLSSVKSTSKSHLFLSYLVFIHDGIYDDGHDVFRIIFNSYLYNGRHNLSTCIAPLSPMSIDDVMNSIIGDLLALKEKDMLAIDKDETFHNINSKVICNFLRERIHLKVKTFKPSFTLSKNPVLENEQDANNRVRFDNVLQVLSSSFDEDIFCDICYDDVNPTKIDAVYGTKLTKCGHHCCDSCWASHFKNKIRDGATTVTCPGYDCKSEIGLVALLSMIDVKDVAVLFQRKAEEEVEESVNAKWCPKPGCGYAIKLDLNGDDFCQDVVCACGTEVCFACLGPAHWPAKCDQAEEYAGKLTSIKPPKESVEEFDLFKAQQKVKKSKLKKPQIFEVEGRVCPQCNRFINKNGGCNYMICKCGRQFCWNCMKPFHNSDCKVDHAYLFKYTRLVRVHHIQRPTENPEVVPQNPKVNIAKQKATLYQRALQQRLEAAKSPIANDKSLVSKIVLTAHKDLLFKEEVTGAMALQYVPENLEELKSLDVKPSVVHLIKSSREIKDALRHVAEFSFVLIQDSPHSLEKQRILRLTNDISGICSILTSILDHGDKQDVKITFKRLLFIQQWAKRALDTLIVATRRLRKQ